MAGRGLQPGNGQFHVIQKMTRSISTLAFGKTRMGARRTDPFEAGAARG
jgi:hypothetical protein